MSIIQEHLDANVKLQNKSGMLKNDKKMFSIVLPIYGNEKNLPVTIPYIAEHLDLFPDYDIELIMVCDGSPDNSWEVMKEMKKRYPDLIRNYRFNKNYYRQIAIACGMDKARGDVVGTMSADMQDPLEMFVEMLRKWEDGDKLVVAARIKRTDSGVGWIFSNIFHGFLTHVNPNYPRGGFDCFLIDRSLKADYSKRIIQAGFMPLTLLGLVDKPGYVEYERRAREIGTSGYKFCRKLRVVVTAMVLETDKLFYWLVFIGLAVCVLSMTSGFVLGVVYKSVYPIFASMLGVLEGIGLSFCGLLGVSIYHWAQELRGISKYIIEEEN